MALFSTSPGVSVREIDQTAGLEQDSITTGAFAGLFVWGPVLAATLVSSEDDLVKQFGKPNDTTAEHFLTAANFLAYGNALRVVRAIHQATALNATADGKTLSGTVSANGTSNALAGSSTKFSVELKVGQTIAIGAGANLVIATITNNTTATLTTVGYTAVANTYQAPGILILNDDDYRDNFSNGGTGAGPWIAKYPGALGNSLKVSICAGANAYASTGSGTISGNTTSTIVIGAGSNFVTETIVGDVIIVSGQERKITAITNSTQVLVNTAFAAAFTANTWTREWEYHDQFNSAPGTSDYTTTRGGANDEMHVVVVDTGINWSSVAGTILETYAYVSKASDAKLTNGISNYYKDAVNRNSLYVRWADHWSLGTNWGTTAASVTFAAPTLPDTELLTGALDGNSAATAADLITGYDEFSSTDVDVSLIIGPPTDTLADATAVGAALVALTESRADAVVFLSPNRNAVVDNAGQELTSVIAWRNTLPASSYGFLDSGWKYQLDKWTDVTRWVPLSGDIAGLAARTDRVAAPWFSIAGFSRGNVKNVLKLAFNPTKAEQDDLYRSSINPVIAPRGQGTVLMGDKTMLSRPSAFDRINVRRLFIVLERTIQSAAEGALFEFNDEFTRSFFVNLIEPYLRDVQAQRGITDFRVICDETNNTPNVVDANEFHGDIYVKPARSINFIQLSFIAVRSGVTFDEVVTGQTEI